MQLVLMSTAWLNDMQIWLCDMDEILYLSIYNFISWYEYKTVLIELQNFSLFTGLPEMLKGSILWC